ncbi:FecR family protein [Pedobacter sp. BMA]|uniref:FecR family protein n=1 Tax=Pedobacter sp. BMA TaxID=1663685 RepID=UPI00064B5FAE|nr:FecR domain-containing protein [Pedobacter sp. BMA]KLT63689.1 hypothetical protein AB669_20760 [Pedobacter sp. BMA]
MKTEQVKELLKRYNDGQASVKEADAVNDWVEQELEQTSWNKSEEDKVAFGIALKLKIDAQINLGSEKEASGTNSLKVTRFRMISAIAAAIAIVLLGTIVFWRMRNEDASRRYANDIAPGKNTAVLKLANGQKINLDERNGTLDTLNGIKIEKAANGVVVFTILDRNADASNQKNTIETPAGGQHQVVLADGTKVWLNAASSLTFPGEFGGQQKRIVSLTGEAYFEVTKDKTHPFLVETAKQEVEVLGTHFNINAYSNEDNIKTTLLEGSVQVSASGQHEVLSPNQQSVFRNNALQVSEIDPALAIDWKNGEFRFKDEPLESILRKLSRWYGVRFVSELDENNTPSFTGSVSRFDNISSVLTMLEETGNIRFFIKNKIITVK